MCLSKYVRLDSARTAGFLRAATALLDAGANPTAGFLLNGEFETALYGAGGVAHHAEMTRLLLERGASPAVSVAEEPHGICHWLVPGCWFSITIGLL